MSYRPNLRPKINNDYMPVSRFQQIRTHGETQDTDDPLDIMQMWINQLDVTTDDKNVTEQDFFGRDAASTTSTVYYGQESFRTFQPKLFRLVQSLVPLEVSLRTISRMKGGGNNRVAGITMDWPAHQDYKFNGTLLMPAREHDTEIRTVFRCYRWPKLKKTDPTIKDTYAVLTFLLQIGIKAPCVLAYDSTCSNPLQIPFILMQRIPGVRLEEIYESLSLKQKLRVTKLIAEELLLYNTVECQSIGTLRGTPGTIPSNYMFMEELPLRFNIEVGNILTGRKHKLPVRSSGSIYSMIKRMLANWVEISESKLKDGSQIYIDWLPYFHQLQEILQVMKERGYFKKGSGENIALHHPDFFARNILISSSIRRPDDMSFKIEGVIDWDDAVALPEVLRSSPPSWLWEWEGPCVTNEPHWEEWYGDSDELPSGRFDFKLDPDAQSIKAYFDEIVGAKRVEYMYTPEYTWIRRLWKFAYRGLRIGNDVEYRRYHHFIVRWTQHVKMTAPLYPNITPKYPKEVDPAILQAKMKEVGASKVQKDSPWPGDIEDEEDYRDESSYDYW